MRCLLQGSCHLKIVALRDFRWRRSEYESVEEANMKVQQRFISRIVLCENALSLMRNIGAVECIQAQTLRVMLPALTAVPRCATSGFDIE